MFSKICFSFLLILIFRKTSSKCLTELQKCSNEKGSTNYVVCCSPLTCVMGECQFVQTGIDCAQKNEICSTNADCCPNLKCLNASSTFSSCQIVILDPTVRLTSGCVADREQCGGFSGILGQSWDGTTTCCSGICTQISIYYSQCLAPT